MPKENALFPLVREDIAFDRLWRQAAESIEQLSGDIWTDTRNGCPGVTLLQSTVWNCSDVAYRTSLSLNDLLSKEGNDSLFAAEFGPQNVLTCNTITPDDYRRALLDLHSSDTALKTKHQDFLFQDACLVKEPDEQRYQWWYNNATREHSFTRPEGAAQSDVRKVSLRGNNWLYLIPTRFTRSLAAAERQIVTDYLDAFLVTHRNLGEQVSRIIWLQPVDFVPRLTLHLDDAAGDINQIVADIYQTLEACVLPATTRYTTAQMREQGLQAEDIFDGPYLQHGWQHAQASSVTEHGIEINLGPLVNQLLAISGVTSVSQLDVDKPPAQISAINGDQWSWRVKPGYFPQLWGADPLGLLSSADSPLRLIAKGGIYPQPDMQGITACLRTPELIHNEPVTLAAGKVRNMQTYIPVGDRLPECYRMQYPLNAVDNSVRELHQFLLPVDQILVDECARLSQLPTLFSFTERGNAIRATQWPCVPHSAGALVHQDYASELQRFQQRSVAIFPENSAVPDTGNFHYELEFLNFLLGYFGTQRAELPLTLDMKEFLLTQRAYLANQPDLGYNRINVQIDRVSALQKRIAARIGLGGECFSRSPDLSSLPFYLIEHRQLLPELPDAAFDKEHKPDSFTVSAPMVTLIQKGSAGKIKRGQLIDLLTDKQGGVVAKRLLVVAIDKDSFSVSVENSQQLQQVLTQLSAAWQAGSLRWKNSNVWLSDMDYRLNYAPDNQQPANKAQRLLASSAQSPYPSLVNVGNIITIQQSAVRNTASEEVEAGTPLLKAVVKQVNPLAGTLLVEKLPESTQEFPAKDSARRYRWFFSSSEDASTDRFSFVVSLVLNRAMIEGSDIDRYQLVSWLKHTVISEFPAHVSLLDHWLDKEAFRDFAQTYARWQNNGNPLGDDAYQIMNILTLGKIPAYEPGISLMRVATPEQRTAVIGADGKQWNTDVILKEELFYVPKETL